MDYINKIHELAKKGFLCEVVTDGWANWEFKENGKPNYDTCTPSPLNLKEYDDVSIVCFRGHYWYFDKNNKLHSDDTGIFAIEIGGIKRAYDELFKIYEAFKDEINPNGFNI